MQSNTSRFFHDHVLVKEPGSSIVTPWHQDQSYYCTSGKQTISFWIPLDNISLNNTLSCISGSHNWGKLHKPKRFDGTDLFENDNSDDVPDIDNNLDKYSAIIPCGIKDKGVTNLKEIKDQDYKELDKKLVEIFISNLNK